MLNELCIFKTDFKGELALQYVHGMYMKILKINLNISF